MSIIYCETGDHQVDTDFHAWDPDANACVKHAPKTCPVHGKSVHPSEEDCPVCGRVLENTARFAAAVDLRKEVE
jgi:hypothetical protein